MEDNKSIKLKKVKNCSGITLLALVVTIVVLLILAGVSIRLVLDNNGIITRAGDTKDKYQIEAIKEAKAMWRAEKGLDSTTESLADYLYKQGVIEEEEKQVVDDGGTITKGKYSVSFLKTLVEAFNDGDLKIGDWVDYENPETVADEIKATDENYSDTGYKCIGTRTGMSISDGYSVDLDQEYSLSNNGKQLNWRILGLSEDGTQLMLTTGSPLQRNYDETQALSDTNNPYLWLRGAKGASTEYGLKELNRICAIYKNNFAAEVRSLTIEDINRLCNVTVNIEEKKVTNISGTNMCEGGNIGTEKTYSNQFQSPEDYIANPTSGKVESFSKVSNLYAYPGKEAIDSEFELYDILFARTGQDNGDYRWYWLASRATYVLSGGCIWGPGDVNRGKASSFSSYLFYSTGKQLNDGGAVRPVVYLNSDVTIQDIHKIETPTVGEEAWNYSWE